MNSGLEKGTLTSNILEAPKLLLATEDLGSAFPTLT